MKWNYMANIIMEYQEQFVNFPGKQGLAIKSNQRIELFDIISCQLRGGGGIILFYFWQEGGRSTFTNYWNYFPQSSPVLLFFFNDLHLQIIQNISTILHWVKFSVCQQSTVTECILNLLDPSTAWGGEGGQLLLIFIDLVSTNILLAMLGFPLSQKRHADFCFRIRRPHDTIHLP